MMLLITPFLLFLESFTGRQAIANTVAGIYILLPGSYLVSSSYTGSVDSNFITDALRMSIVIGVGGWTGTILCSPALLGGLLWQQQPKSMDGIRRRGWSNKTTNRPPLPSDNGKRRDKITTTGALENKRRVSNNSSQVRHRPVASKVWSSSTSPPCHDRNGSHCSGSSPPPTDSGMHHHNRLESAVSIFDFDDPKSTVLYF
jgi:hypothetical protein